MKLKSLDYADIIESFTNRYENIVKKMRFQQRQQQERDQRKVEMISTTKTAVAAASSVSTTNHHHSGNGSSTTSSSTIRSSAISTATATATTTMVTSNGNDGSASDLSASLGAGKVRQMFDERRHRVAGIDKSYPLQPIQPTTKVVSNGNNNSSNVTNGNGAKSGAAAGLNNKTRVPPISANTKARLAMQQRQQQQQQQQSQDNGNGENFKATAFDDNENLLDDEKFPDTISFDDELSMTASPIIRKLPNVGKLNGPPAPPQNVNSVKLKPVPGRTPSTATTATTNAKTNAAATKSAAPKKQMSSVSSPTPSAVRTSAQTSPAKSSPSSRASTGKSTMAATSVSRKPSAASSASPATPARDAPVPDGMANCTICGRNFAEDRIDKHREICQKTKSKKRKVFDVTKQRVQGTDAEKYVLRKKGGATTSKKSISGASTTKVGTGAGAGKGKSDWRRKHEEFIQAIRAAKEMQAHLAKGGKLSDLPPPPPSENPDYIQCPHCSRRFNQTAAERHIPKCANMLHNKTKPATKANQTKAMKRF